MSLLEQKKAELNITQAEIQALKYEQSVSITKVRKERVDFAFGMNKESIVDFQLDKFDEINQDLKRHLSVLEKSNEEHKKLIRKRDKELENVRNELEQHISNSVALNHKVFCSFSSSILFSGREFLPTDLISTIFV